MDYYFAAIVQGLCLAPMCFGIFITIKIFNFPDITTDGSYTLGAVVCAVGLRNELPLVLLIPTICLSGAAAGTVTAFIHTKLKVNALLAGILVMTALYSVNLTLLGRSNVPLQGYDGLFSFTLSAYPLVNMFILAGSMILVLALLLNYLLRTDFGIAMRATGNNELMVRSLGINTAKMKWVGLAATNALVAFSGALIAQFQGFTDINMGIGVVIGGLGSVMIAQTIMSVIGYENVWISLLTVIFGVITFQLVIAFTLNTGIDASLLKLLTSCFVLIIVAFPNTKWFKALKR